MVKTRIYFVCEILLLAKAIEQSRILLCENSKQGYKIITCPENNTISLKSITYGESPCQDADNNRICHSNIDNYFKNHCAGQNNCTLPVEILSNNSCKPPPRRLKVKFKCDKVTWWGIRQARSVEACANSLKEVYCPAGDYIHIGNTTSSITTSGCDSLNVYKATKILKRLCNENRSCSPDTSTTSLLYHERFASIQYMCKEPTDRPVTESIYSTRKVSTVFAVTEITQRTSSGECVTNSSIIISPITSESSTIAGIASTLVSIIVTALLIIVIVCYRKKKAKNSKPCRTAKMTKERTDASDYKVIGYNEMTDISIIKINQNKIDSHAKQHQQQNIYTSIEQDQNMCNKYESVSTNRNLVEHFYDSDPIQINHYESLRNPRKSEKHIYESTEKALQQDITTSIEQENNICNKYESLSTNRNSVEHVYELDLININQYESLTKQRELNNHTYESTELAQPHDMEQDQNICNKYELLSTNRNSDKHIYESDSIHTNQYELLTKPPETDKHTYESTEHAQPHDIIISSEPEYIICNKYESLSTNRNSVEHTYESTEQTLPVSQYQSLTNSQESDKHVYASTESPH